MKKLSQKGIAHHLMIVGIAVLVVAAVGFAGFRVYKGKNSDSAKAASYTTIASWRNGSTLKACKKPISSGYGALWEVKLIATNPVKSTEKVGYEFYVERGKNLVQTVKFPLMNAGVASAKTTYASKQLSDTYSVSVGNGSMGGGSAFASMSNFSTITCRY